MTEPLSEKLRPHDLNEIFGQEHLLNAHGVIANAIREQRPLSILLWGPPGCGKTSIARLYAKAFGMHFKSMSAIFSGIQDLKKIVQEVKSTPLFGRGVVLFVDEIHRFNKAQQDAFLPFVEDGTIILVGATAENPSFYLNNALLSRLRVLTLAPLSKEALHQILNRYEEKYPPLPLTEEAREDLIHYAQGDGRYLLNLVENIVSAKPPKPFSTEELQTLVQRKLALYDRAGDHHYNLISALHKSVRGSDADGALYWLARMLEGGEDPLFIARRLMRMASEDIGLADPQAMQITLSARQHFEALGSPEGELALAQAVLYLALAPKSNSCYLAYNQAKELAKKTTQLNPPKLALNAPTRLMKEEGFGKGYTYDHDQEKGCAGQNYFPDEIERVELYQPVSRGFEREMQKRLTYFSEIRNKQMFDGINQ